MTIKSRGEGAKRLTNRSTVDMLVLILLTWLHAASGAYISTADNAFQTSYGASQDLEASFSLHIATDPQTTLLHDLRTPSRSLPMGSLSSAFNFPTTTTKNPYLTRPKLQSWIEQGILGKLLDRQQIDGLEAKGDRRTAQRSRSSGAGSSTTSDVLQSVHIVGISPSFAAALRHLYQKQISKLLGVGSLQWRRRSKRQAGDDLQAKIVDVEREGNSSVVNLDFYLENNGSLVSMETALEKLQALSTEQMAALLGVPIISPPVQMFNEVQSMTSSGMMTSQPATSSESSKGSTLHRHERSIDSDYSQPVTRAAFVPSLFTQIVPTSVVVSSLPVDMTSLPSSSKTEFDMLPSSRWSLSAENAESSLALHLSQTVSEAGVLVSSSASHAVTSSPSSDASTPVLKTDSLQSVETVLQSSEIEIATKSTETSVVFASQESSQEAGLFTTADFQTQSLGPTPQLTGSVQTESLSFNSMLSELSSRSAAETQRLESETSTFQPDMSSSVLTAHLTASSERLDPLSDSMASVSGSATPSLLMTPVFSVTETLSDEIVPSRTESVSDISSVQMTVQSHGSLSLESSVSDTPSLQSDSGAASTASMFSQKLMPSEVRRSEEFSSDFVSDYLLSSSSLSSYTQLPEDSLSSMLSQSLSASFHVSGNVPAFTNSASESPTYLLSTFGLSQSMATSLSAAMSVESAVISLDMSSSEYYSVSSTHSLESYWSDKMTSSVTSAEIAHSLMSQSLMSDEVSAASKVNSDSSFPVTQSTNIYTTTPVLSDNMRISDTSVLTSGVVDFDRPSSFETPSPSMQSYILSETVTSDQQESAVTVATNSYVLSTPVSALFSSMDIVSSSTEVSVAVLSSLESLLESSASESFPQVSQAISFGISSTPAIPDLSATVVSSLSIGPTTEAGISFADQSMTASFPSMMQSSSLFSGPSTDSSFVSVGQSTITISSIQSELFSSGPATDSYFSVGDQSTILFAQSASLSISEVISSDMTTMIISTEKVGSSQYSSVPHIPSLMSSLSSSPVHSFSNSFEISALVTSITPESVLGASSVTASSSLSEFVSDTITLLFETSVQVTPSLSSSAVVPTMIESDVSSLLMSSRLESSNDVALPSVSMLSRSDIVSESLSTPLVKSETAFPSASPSSVFQTSFGLHSTDVFSNAFTTDSSMMVMSSSEISFVSSQNGFVSGIPTPSASDLTSLSSLEGLESSSLQTSSEALSPSPSSASGVFYTLTPSLGSNDIFSFSSEITSSDSYFLPQSAVSSAFSPAFSSSVEAMATSSMSVPIVSSSLTPSLPDVPVFGSSETASQSSPVSSPATSSEPEQTSVERSLSVTTSVSSTLPVSDSVLPTSALPSFEPVEPSSSSTTGTTSASSMLTTPASSYAETTSQSREPDVTTPSPPPTSPAPVTPPRSFLRLKIKVDPGVDIKSPEFQQRLREALGRLYLEALAASARKQAAQQGRRRKRSVSHQVDAQLLNVERNADGDVVLDFMIAQDGEHVPVDSALATLRALTDEKMAEILTFPVLDLKKEVTLGSTLTIGQPTNTDLVVVTSNGLIFATSRSSTVTSSSVHVTSTMSPIVPSMTSSSVVTSPSASVSAEVSSSQSASDLQSSGGIISSLDISPSIFGSYSTSSAIITPSLDMSDSLLTSFIQPPASTSSEIVSSVSPSLDMSDSLLTSFIQPPASTSSEIVPSVSPSLENSDSLLTSFVQPPSSSSDIVPSVSSSSESAVPSVTVSPGSSVDPTESATPTPPFTPTFSIPTEETVTPSSPAVTSISTTSPTATESPMPATTATILPTPTTTPTIPTSSVTPTLSDALMQLDLELKPEDDEQGQKFKDEFERGIVLAYQRAMQTRRKRNAPTFDVIMQARGHVRRVRQAGQQIDAEVTSTVRNNSDPRITNVTFFVMENGTPVPATNASLTLNRLSPNVLSAIIAYPVVSLVRPVNNQLLPPQPYNDDVSLLFVVAIVMPCILVLLLAFVLMGILYRSCREPAPLPPDAADVVPTKYQRGESLDDYNLHVDVERGEIVDRTPGHTPNPASRKHGHDHPTKKTPLHPYQQDTLDSKRFMIDQWLKGEEKQRSRRSSYDSADSLAKSDTCLYANQGKDKSRDKSRERSKEKSKHLEVPQETYKNEYLQALSIPETELREKEELTGDGTGERKESFALEERSFEAEDMKKPLSPPHQQEPPQAKPRGIVSKLRDSMRRRGRSVTPEYNNTQSTVVSGLGDSAHNLTDRSRDPSAERSRDSERHAQHTDASDEFTMIMPTSNSARSSRERLVGSNSSLAAVEPEQTSALRYTPVSTKPPQPKSRRGKFSPESSNEEITYPDHRLDRPQELSNEGFFPSLLSTMTQTSLTSSSGGSRSDDVRTKSIAVGPDGVSKKTQTPSSRPKPPRRTKPPQSGSARNRLASHPLLQSSSSSSQSQLLGSSGSMEEDQMEEEFAPERIEPFAKMSQMSMSTPEKDISIPVKFRRNVFDDGSVIPPPDEEEASVGVGQMFHKPARHMRAQPRVPYSAMNPEERRQAEMLDTAVARQQLLLRQQQEVMAYAHRQQVEQQAQRLVNNSLAVGTTSTTPVNKQLQPHAERQKLNNLLNEACLLAPQRPGVQQPMAMQGGMAWVPAQPVISSEGYYNQVSVLNNAPAGVVPPTAVPGSFSVMGQDELMQAVRKELKRIQQE